MNISTTSIYWFRQDLRLSDNPALSKALENDSVVVIYILDTINPDQYFLGSASRWWLHNSLLRLNDDLGNRLSVYKGDPENIINNLCKQYNTQSIYWNRCYEPWRINRDKNLKKNLQLNSIEAHTFNASLLWEPWEILKKDDTPYKVFSPFYKNGCLNSQPPKKPIKKPNLDNILADKNNKNTIYDLKLIPKHHWYKKLENKWIIGEPAAKKKLSYFLKNGLPGYKEGRNYPAKENVSQLSPYLHFGEISPNQIWAKAKQAKSDLISDDDLFHFLSELGWREFSYYLLYHFPALPEENFQKKFDKFPWKKNTTFLDRWKKGMTGYPIVDAGMRELWETGYMHNRVRMIVGSFLVKNLLSHWKNGERWFWDCLVDADLASNSASWQWVAGSGADAAPYFRIFNPVTQGVKFDPDGSYTKKYLPELEDMPKIFLFNPWEAPIEVLNKANVVLGKTYPEPIVDLKESREEALDAFSTTKI